MLFSEADLRRIFPKAYLDRGRALADDGHVLEVNFPAPLRIQSVVLGTGMGEYKQEITLFTETGPFRVEGDCTCPVGFNCKHIASVMITVMQSEELSRHLTQPAEIAKPAAGTIETDPALDRWLQQVRAVVREEEDSYPPTMRQRVVYVISPLTKAGRQFVVVEALTAGLRTEGGFSKPTELRLASVGSGHYPKCALEVDRNLIEGMQRNLESPLYPNSAFALAGPEAPRFITTLLRTGRCFYGDLSGNALRLTEPRRLHFSWHMGTDGNQTFVPNEEGLVLIPSIPPFAIDALAGTCAQVESDAPPKLLAELLKCPPIPAEHSERVARSLGELIPEVEDLLPRVAKPPVLRPVMPDPILHVAVRCFEKHDPLSWRKKAVPPKRIEVTVARIEYDYDGILVGGTPREAANSAPLRKMVGDQLYLIRRLPALEADYEAELYAQGWAPISAAQVDGVPSEWSKGFAFLGTKAETPAATSRRFSRWTIESVPKLRDNGWLIHIEGERGLVRSESVTWDVQSVAEPNDWFSLSLGVVIDGVRHDLRPILIDALSQLVSLGIKDLSQASDEIELFPELPDGRILLITVGRIKPIIEALTQLFGSVEQWSEDQTFHSTQAADAQALNDLANEHGFKWQEPDRLAEVRARLEAMRALPAVTSPASFRGDLRPYQVQGLGWMQFLGELGFGGILADDMGLGKTVQTLAHLVAEKEKGRLTHPALIVAPTSTIPNWRHEVAKFAPSLKLLTLHGQDRKSLFDEIPGNDVVLTSYALLARDRERLTTEEFSVVVLDEAQNIKNHRANVSQAATGLKATQRICLSGTPIENRLDELWSLFHFLMPGLLGNAAAFKRNYSAPIESHGDDLARLALTRKIRPFILRRTKELVAPELPEKTEVIERVEMGETQRDLYETLRLAMDKRVRDLFATKGFEKSRIEILDALLKLRQVCCDPRLVKLPAAQGIHDSAKLERLIEMIVEMLAEGRRILLFSQFTSMLDLIEGGLKKEGLEWVRISGDTDDRDTPVRRFQALEVPLFLISLRAGGTGLNLTAADTVIHYDPWWNPAVENQATDRAHRIGQDKHVFVYKMVAEGTVEEKILDLQDKKAALAESVLAEGADPVEAMSVDDFLEVLR